MAAISYNGFSFTFPQANAPVAGPLDWDVPEGSFSLLIGATGSGKTTLLRCAKPELAPRGQRTGTVLVCGEDAAGLSVAQSVAKVGYVAQSPETQLVCSSVWHQMAFGLENLGIAQGEMRRRVAEVAHFFGMEPWFQADVNALSGGQKQLLNLASVLVMQPRILLLDEPTAQLDPVAERNFLHALFRLNRELGFTVVVATHAPEAMVGYATHAFKLEGGTVEQVPVGAFAQVGGDGMADARLGSAPPVGAGDVRPAGAGDAGGALPAGAGGVSAAGTGSVRRATYVPTRGGQPVLRLNDVHFRYSRSSAPVLRGLDLEVEPRSIHALVGGNGSGKSTLLRVAAGVHKPQRGKAENTLRLQQALLPQDPKALFACDTVAEELREWQRACGYGESEVEEALAFCGLQQRTGVHPYDLSGGQQQLLALQKLLLTKPRLLLLDEPTKGLDTESRCAVASALVRARAQGVTVVLASHDLSFVRSVAGQVTMIFDGQAACTQGTVKFFQQNLFYRPLNDAFSRTWEPPC